MSRYSRKSDPVLPRKLRVELEDSKIGLRLLIVGVALAIAFTAFGAGLTGLLSGRTGWQIIEPATAVEGIDTQFYLAYNIPESGSAAHRKAVAGVYADSLGHAYRTLANAEFEHYTNLHTLNAHPNEVFTVDPILYDAFALLGECRLPYYAPVYEQYLSLFACSEDAAAELFDPARSADAAEFTARAAAFAADPASVRVELLPDHQLRLNVSPEYGQFLEEYGVESIVDFGLLLNAFLTDCVADALEAQGYTDCYLSSADGYTRVLCGLNMTLAIPALQDGQVIAAASVCYDGPAAIVSCRSFPALESDKALYHVYADGTTVGPYLGPDGLSHSTVSFLATAQQGSAAALAIRTLPAFSSADLPPADTGRVIFNGGLLTLEGDFFSPAQ